jgi:hypothetical protein
VSVSNVSLNGFAAAQDICAAAVQAAGLDSSATAAEDTTATASTTPAANTTAAVAESAATASGVQHSKVRRLEPEIAAITAKLRVSFLCKKKLKCTLLRKKFE